MQFAILESKFSNYHEYTIVYKEEDIYYYSFPKLKSPQIYWNNNIQNVLKNSTIKKVTDFDMPSWINRIVINDIIWLDIDKPENILILYPELFI